MKEHIRASLTGDLHEIAVKYHNYGCLRELINQRITEALYADKEWYDTHPEDKPII